MESTRTVITWPQIHLGLRPEVVAALVFAILLVAYGNAYSALPAGVREPYDWAFILGGFVFMVTTVAGVVRFQRLGLTDLGFTVQRLWSGSLIGLGVGVAVILPVVFYFLFPFGLPGGSIEYEGAEEMSAGSFLIWSMVRQPLGTSLFEEVMFRGVLQALSVRAYGLGRGILFSALTFALWHLVINYRTIQETNATESIFLTIGAQVLSLLGVLIGGLFLGALRNRTGGLAAPIAFHWAVVVAMHGTLFGLAG